MLKVGDHVRIHSQGVSLAIAGKEAEVVFIRENGSIYLRLLGLGDELIYVPKQVISKIEKEQETIKRIRQLEQEVAQLKESIASLNTLKKKKPQSENTPKERQRVVIQRTANDRRKQAIEDAKAFVRKYDPTDGMIILPDENGQGFRRQLVSIGYHVHYHKREVVVHVFKKPCGTLVGKGIARCKPTDIFNEAIGKAIALGRALNLNVSRFEYAQKPTEIVAGMEIFDGEEVRKVLQVATSLAYLGKGLFDTKAIQTEKGWIGESRVTIVDDSFAEYR